MIKGKESYSIPIKTKFADDAEDYFFENLNYMKLNEQFISFITKYNATDDSKAFDFKNFTGDLQVFDDNKVFQGVMSFENGTLKHLEPAPPGPPDETIGGSGSSDSTDPDCPCNSSGNGFFHNLFNSIYDFITGITITPGAGDSGTNYGSGYILIMGTSNNPGGTGNTNGSGTGVIVPNAPNWPESAPQIIQANNIYGRLGIDNIQVRTWLRSIDNKQKTDEIYVYLRNVSADKDVTIISDALTAIISGEKIANVVNLDEQITSNLPNCLDDILQDIKTLQNSKFGQVIKQFAGLNPLPVNYNWNVVIASIPTSPGSSFPPAAITSNSSGIVTTTINSYYLNQSTNLSFARTIIHEAFHAYLTSVYRYQNIDKSYVNLVNKYASQFNGNVNDIHHHVFAQDNIISHISSALMEYGTLKGYNLTQQYCDDMAWAGLIGTKSWNMLNQNEQDRILSTLEAETFNSNGNLLSITPVGTKACP